VAFRISQVNRRDHSELLTVRELKSSGWYAVGMGDVMLCDREIDIHPSQKFDATIHSEKMTSSQYFYSANVNFQQLFVFAMNNKASPPSTNTTKKCRDPFLCFPSSESRLAGEHTVGFSTCIT
jgi:hypothetical protein